LPSGATGTSTTNSIDVDFGTNALSGEITVKGNNDCGEGALSTLAIEVDPLPAGAGSISGALMVCQGENAVTYTVPAIANATSYVWTLPSGATGTSTTNSIDVDFGTNALSGDITVKGNNDCGEGAMSALAIEVDPLPASAGSISGALTVCQGENAVTYTVPAIANATSYVWTLPSGATGTSTTNSIDVDFGTNALSGEITVKGNNDCGEGALSTLAIEVDPLPAGAGSISGALTVCQGENAVTYTVPAIANATSYVWTLPSGATGSSTTNSIDVDFGTNALSGDITVKGNNDCGEGALSTLAIEVDPLPAGAGSISGALTVCQGENAVTYTVPAIANATSYVWTLPSGATGTSTTNSIDVDFGTNALSGIITVNGANTCGNGPTSTFAVTVNVKPITPVISLNGFVLHSDAPSGNQWYNQNGFINGATNQDYTVSVNGDYYVIVTLLGCSSDASNILNVTVTGIGLSENNKTIKVYPNPVSNELIIEIEWNIGNINFDIINTIGQVILKGNLVERAIVQTSNFAPGVYIIKLENGKTFEFKKIIKE
jgi:stress response protein SCP2